MNPRYGYPYNGNGRHDERERQKIFANALVATGGGGFRIHARIFVNLIENALRHTPDGSTIGMSLAKGENGPIAEVYDDGPGIPEPEHGNVFKNALSSA